MTVSPIDIPPPDCKWYSELIQWINANGGYINESLVLKEVRSDARGVFAKNDISKGSLLIKLPNKLSVSGSAFPLRYTCQNEDQERLASPWLRCITAIFAIFAKKEEESNCDFEHYISSLPNSYETLLHKTSWPDDQVEKYLSGTHVGKMVLQDRKFDTLRTRFHGNIKPYLLFNGLIGDTARDDDVFELIKKCCACVSTRGFHLNTDNSSSPSTQSSSSYSGPFLLPFIDLLNHSSTAKDRCTSLSRQMANSSFITSSAGGSGNNAQGVFLMSAERDISKDEEILHSYGNDLTSGQLLQTFGFVESMQVKRATQNSYPSTDESDNVKDITPAVLSRQSIIDACVHIASSGLPQELEDKMDSIPELDFDVWDMPSTGELDARNQNVIQKQFSDALIINNSDSRLLSEEIITLCCAQFLPDEAYDEICESSEGHSEGKNVKTLALLSPDILEDFFLGSLVLRAIDFAIGRRLSEYKKIELPGYEIPDGKDVDIDVYRDRCLLKAFVIKMEEESSKGDDQQVMSTSEMMHAIYGLTIRIEEKTCLLKLKKECGKLLKSLCTVENGISNSVGDEAAAEYDDRPSKRIKL